MQLAKRHLLLLHTLTIIMLNDKLFYIVAINWYRKKYLEELRMPVLKGSFKVNLKKIAANVQYAALFYDDRVVFARVGGHWANARVSSVAEVHRQLEQFRLMRVEDILKLRKKNFQVMYGELVKVKLKDDTWGNIRIGLLSIVTVRQTNFDILLNQDFLTCLNIVRAVLPGKLEANGIPALQPVAGAAGIHAPDTNAPPSGYADGTVATTVNNKTLEDMENVKNERAVKNSANWFFLIAGLSVVNSIIYLSGSKLTFLIGLGITQFIGGYASGAGSEMVPFAVVLSLLIAAVFVFCGIFARKQQSWAFVTGMILYALDALLFLWVKDWLSLAFHAFALFVLFGGAAATFKLKNKMQATLE
jgi:hypothetical protein